ncbi:isopenicillin N synthase family dioxygenase [Vogesella indigofera]|uniref:isopenicillin N synthase family dioxygenase n=1 Tax=Vogesella indigofera TaxID=45465 RepID=UPI00234F5B65|nr:2-oxoglutarate and iron-dependent oxygenase domain-containing protein [Vogesella indigofera]MDC7698252.1 2-oxoglutarate and iron-dependent oxygenase domain-containing protein [Vogesella indigofera]
MSQPLSLNLPLLTLSDLDGSPARRAAFLRDLRAAARDVGFFYLNGHGIAEAQAARVLAAARDFFALPQADKRAVDMVQSPHFRGYTAAGHEITRLQPDWREQFDIGAERPPLAAAKVVPVWARLQGPNQWPAALPALRPALLAWQAELTAVSIRLLRAFAEALQQPADSFDDAFLAAPIQHLKIIRYPGQEQVPSDQGVGAHKDSGFLTLLLQDREAGLQVETASGWVDAPPVAGTFIVNIGEALELASNGYLRATVHRVLSPAAGRERLSVAFFLGPRLDATVPLLPLTPKLAREAPGPATDPANPLFYETGFNMLKGRLRSHPEVARRHYADVLAASA